jgi:hypothetical protein
MLRLHFEKSKKVGNRRLISDYGLPLGVPQDLIDQL